MSSPVNELLSRGYGPAVDDRAMVQAKSADDITIANNLDRKIQALEIQLARIKQIRDNMPTDLMKMKISDLAEAMQVLHY